MALYTVKIFKSFVDAPEKEWSNSYEVNGPGAIDLQFATATVNAIVAGERSIHRTYVEFIRGVVSTFVADSAPYDPNTFVTVDISGTGSRPGNTGNREPIDVVLWVKRLAASGRSGKLFYRGVVEDPEVAAPGARRQLTPEALLAYEGLISGLFSLMSNEGQVSLVMAGVSLLNIIYPATAAGVKQVPIRSYSQLPYVRVISNFGFGGVRSVDDDNN
jgi:hypothetical protein